MLYFTVAIFLSAFLLFQVQSMIGKFILPWFGGTPAVWSTAMLFFQAMLTGGYAYAYWLVKRPKQGWIHLALLGMTLALLTALGLAWPSPITPPAELRPAAADFPVFQIILLLAVCVGLPYFVLAANGPLMQAWFSRVFPERSYARLYALSNAGSLSGLVVYPILIEPLFAVNQQAWIWTLGFVVFALVAGLLGYRARNERGISPTVARTEKPSASMRVMWIVLSGTASLFLLSVTSRITQEVAVIPFLWVIPLTIYLLSFILTFSDSRWYDRRIYAVLFGVLGIFVWGMPGAVTGQNVVVQIGFYALMLFLACMICHGELHRLRPHADHLTSFYLMISIGGAAGGIFVNLVAPFIFTGYWEFYLAWLLTAVLLAGALLPRLRERVGVQAAALTLSIPLMVVGLALWLNPLYGALFAERNFYGLVRVRQWGGSAYSMVHGITLHGLQFTDDRSRPTAYFMEESGIGLLLRDHPMRGNGMHVGVLGLGVGTLAAYGEEGDRYRFYEINPAVIRLAEGQGGYFTYLSDSRANVSVIPGDARLSMERELAAGEPQDFDVLILDAFSSDSVPVHLVTREAFALYLQRLHPDGVIAANITNHHLDFQPLFWRLAQEYGLAIVRVERFSGLAEGEYGSHWIFLAQDSALFDTPAFGPRAKDFDGYSTSVRLWTDDYSNLFQLLK